MPIRKINKKRLSRNVRLKHAPLKVLPLSTTFGTRNRIKKKQKELVKQQESITLSPVPVPPQRTVQCPIEVFPRDDMRHQKKSGRRKVPITVLPFVKARFRLKALRWIFLTIFILLAIGITIILVQDGFGSMKNIIIYGVMGFFTFFMGYFGTIFAKDILEIVMEKKNSRDEANIDT